MQKISYWSSFKLWCMFTWRYVMYVSVSCTVIVLFMMMFEPLRRPILTHVGGDVLVLFLLLIFTVAHLGAQLMAIRDLFSSRWQMRDRSLDK